MRKLVPSCYVGVISAIERTTLIASLRKIFQGSRDSLFIAPICRDCHRRFVEINDTVFDDKEDFDIV